MIRWFSPVALSLTLACGGAPSAPPTVAPGAPPKLSRLEFNARAQARAVPLFWRADLNADGWPDGDELVLLWGPGEPKRGEWLRDGQPTQRLWDAIRGLREGAGSDEPAEATRLERLEAELARGRPTLAEADLSDLPAPEKAMLGHLLAAGRHIERLYLLQKGALRHADGVGDPLSRAVFFRNQGPWCAAPKLEADPDCSALAARPPRRFGLYPDGLQDDKEFCQALAARPDGQALLGQFNAVVQSEGGGLRAVPYHQHYGEEMRAVARALEAAAQAIADHPPEAALHRYLLAAATGFRTNDWYQADEAWAAMGPRNSRWYLRIGPDETYFETCNAKAAFHMGLARIDQGSLKWQDLLDPLKGDMERALAALAGPPYAAREVSFKLPDFIHIVLNTGDARNPFGATIGQSLPNWGPVANEGRGRTVAMTNLYTDADSRQDQRLRARSVLCPEAMGRYSDAEGPEVLGTVLHEAAHNLGPAHEYAVDGKDAGAVFGGPLAATLEELKAQTAALYFTEWLGAREVIDRELVEQAHLRSLLWAFGQQSAGMYTGEGRPRPYPQLAAIQVGALTDAGVLAWQPEIKAANGEDSGCYLVDYAKLPTAAEALMAQVAGIKARGDRPAAEALKARYVDAEGPAADLRETIRLRWERTPKASFVYALPGL